MYERGEQVGNDGSFDLPDLFYDLCQPFVPPFQVFRFLIAVPEKIVSFHGFRFFRVRVWKYFIGFSYEGRDAAKRLASLSDDLQKYGFPRDLHMNAV